MTVVTEKLSRLSFGGTIVAWARLNF